MFRDLIESIRLEARTKEQQFAGLHRMVGKKLPKEPEKFAPVGHHYWDQAGKKIQMRADAKKQGVDQLKDRETNVGLAKALAKHRGQK